jgi:hypothetical protein
MADPDRPTPISGTGSLPLAPSLAAGRVPRLAPVLEPRVVFISALASAWHSLRASWRASWWP